MDAHPTVWRRDGIGYRCRGLCSYALEESGAIAEEGTVDVEDAGPVGYFELDDCTREAVSQ